MSLFPPRLDLDVEVPQPRAAAGRRPRARRFGTTYAGPGINPTPETPAVMDATTGAWVREHVLRGYLPGATEAYFTHCACQYGLCGGCERGRCDRCLTIQFGGGRPLPETHITDRKGFVRGIRGWDAAVYLAHTTCRYLCPCQCRKVAPPPPARRPEQLDLFALLEAS